MVRIHFGLLTKLEFNLLVEKKSTKGILMGSGKYIPVDQDLFAGQPWSAPSGAFLNAKRVGEKQGVI